MFAEDFGFYPFAFGFIGCMINTALGCLGSFPTYFPKATLKSFTSNLVITWILILFVYAGFPILKAKFPALDTTTVQITLYVGIGCGGIPAFKFIWLLFCNKSKKELGIDPNDCIKKDNKPANEQSS